MSKDLTLQTSSLTFGCREYGQGASGEPFPRRPLGQELLFVFRDEIYIGVDMTLRHGSVCDDLPRFEVGTSEHPVL